MNNKLSGLIMAVIGFILIFLNAVGYLFDYGVKSPALVVIGLVFVAIGMASVKKKKR